MILLLFDQINESESESESDAQHGSPQLHLAECLFKVNVSCAASVSRAEPS